METHRHSHTQLYLRTMDQTTRLLIEQALTALEAAQTRIEMELKRKLSNGTKAGVMALGLEAGGIAAARKALETV